MSRIGRRDVARRSRARTESHPPPLHLRRGRRPRRHPSATTTPPRQLSPSPNVRQAVECFALLLALLSQAGRADAARLRVCAFSFHGPREIRVFQDRLPPDAFDVVDLSPHLGSPAPAAPAASWIFDRCRPDLRCDVVVFSGEFAGSFFGAYGTSLGVADMEEASCQARCDGLFHDPQEVFLLGCNTLATKDQDSRTPAEYLQVLLDHGFDRATAERVVGTRYGPLGPSFRESLRRVFMGVPRLYGFSSVAPAGERTAPLLDAYFRRKGDYGRYLDRSGRDTGRNAELFAAFRGTALVQATGLGSAEPGAADRELTCHVYDESASVAERLRIVQRLMARPDFLSFLPAIQVFLDRHPPDGFTREERRLLDEIARSQTARDMVMRLVHDLDVSALQLELAHFARHLGWLTPDAFRALAVGGVRQLLARPLTSEVVDVACEISRHEPLHDWFGSDDLPPQLFRHPEGLRLIDCLQPADPRVTARLLPCLDDPDLSMRLWAAYALSHRLPLGDAILAQMAVRLDDPSEDMRERVRWIMRAEAPLSDAVRRAVRAHDPTLADTLGRR